MYRPSPEIRRLIAQFNATTAIMDVIAVDGELRRTSSTNGGEWHGPCPLCGGEDRCAVWPEHPDGPRAWCRRCGTWGDSLRWSILIAGHDPDAPGTTAKYLTDRGLRSLPPGGLCPRRIKRPKTTVRPPQAEVEGTWAKAVPVVDDSEAAAWVRSRGLDPLNLTDLDLARVVQKARLPGWARRGRASWVESGHRLLVPLLNSDGRLVSLKARRLGQAKPKTLCPRGASTHGLVMADPLAQCLLRGQGAHVPCLVVAEGVSDFLSFSSMHGVDGALEQAPAVLGVFSGSLTKSMAGKIPGNTKVVVATDSDEAGDAYARRTDQLLGHRCSVRRWRP